MLPSSEQEDNTKDSNLAKADLTTNNKQILLSNCNITDGNDALQKNDDNTEHYDEIEQQNANKTASSAGTAFHNPVSSAV